MTTTTKTIALILLASVAACKGKQAAPAADPAPSAKTVEPLPTAAAAPAATGACKETGPAKINLAAGETIMKDRDKGTEQIMVNLKDAHTTLALVEKTTGDKTLMQLRAFTACGSTNLNEWMTKGVAGITLEAQTGGALLVNSTFADTDEGSAPKGAMNYRQIRLENGAAKITKTWDCDDSKASGHCTDDGGGAAESPDWIIDGKIDGAPESPEG